MGLSRIVMRLARNPGTEFAGGDDHRGYSLTAHGVKAEPQRLERSDPAAALIRLAAETGAGLIVAGAFGHARLREFIFGGVTRNLLHADGPSLFLSH